MQHLYSVCRSQQPLLYAPITQSRDLSATFERSKMSSTLNGRTILFLCNWFCNPCASLERSVKQFGGIFVAILGRSVRPLSLQAASPVLPLCNPRRPAIYRADSRAMHGQPLSVFCAFSVPSAATDADHSAVIQRSFSLCFWQIPRRQPDQTSSSSVSRAASWRLFIPDCSAQWHLCPFHERALLPQKFFPKSWSLYCAHPFIVHLRMLFCSHSTFPPSSSSREWWPGLSSSCETLQTEAECQTQWYMCHLSLTLIKLVGNSRLGPRHDLQLQVDLLLPSWIPLLDCSLRWKYTVK